uniref:Large ribosomal subunit protein uL16m n=1 Tax=Salix viminalis TaxID=40686 RepID=A0A6N2KQM8_SALVM
MPYPTSFMPDLNAIDYLLHARGLLCSWLGELSSLQTKNIDSPITNSASLPGAEKWLRNISEPMRDLRAFPLRGAGKNPHGGWTDGTQLGFGRYGTKSCKAGRLSYRAIEAARRAIIGQFRRNGKIWVRVLADLPITGKPTEIRMGRGKGNPTGWIARVSTGQILFEMDGVSLSNARQAATLAAHKPCSSTKFVQWS